MTNKKSYKEKFTAYPNRYTDYIKPRLTDTERAICDVVIRLTIGWQRPSARISNATLVKRAGKSERAIINAKRKLLQLGLLVQLEPARSTTPALYTIDLYYNDPKRRMEHPQLTTQPIEQLPDDLLSNSIDNSAPNTMLLDVPVMPELSLPNEASIHDNMSSIHEEAPPSTMPSNTIEIPTHHDSEDTAEPSQACTDQTPSNPNNECHVDTVVATNQGQGCTATNAPHFDNDNSGLNMYSLKQTTENAPTKQSATNAIQADIRDVCYKFINLFPEAKDDSTWKFIGWAVTTYGQDKCIEKLDYIREYRKLHPIANPKGLLRVALAKDYQPSRWIAGMMKGRRQAEADYQRSQALFADMERVRRNIDYEAGKAALSNIIAMLEEKERQKG